MKRANAEIMPAHEHIGTEWEPCRTVVQRAYMGLRLAGQDRDSAFRAAVMVLSLRRPGLTQEDYEHAVLTWLAGQPEEPDEALQ